MTLNEYLIKFRLKKTTALLNEGATLQSAAEKCGFNDSSNFIQSFKRYFGSTPVKCINNISDKNRYAPKD